MAIPTSNYGTSYYNINQCVSFNQKIPSATTTKLSSFPCSQVTIWNHTGTTVHLSACNCIEPYEEIRIPPGEAATPLYPVIIMGLTNSDQISGSIHGTPGTMDLYCRAEYFSSNPVR